MALDVSIIVPTYREAPNIRPLTERILAATDAAGLSVEILIVDDRSPDGTADEVRALAASHPIRLIERDGPRSLAAAVLDGFAAARSDILLVLDADLSHPPEVIPQLVRRVASGEADFAIGSRYVESGAMKDWPWIRRLMSATATRLASPLLPRGRVRDPMSGFFCLRRQTWLRADAINAIGYKIGLELLVKAHCERVVEVPITFTDRVAGESKLTAREQLRYLQHLKRLYEYRWPRLALSLVFAAIGTAALLVDLAVMNLLWGLGVAPFAIARSAGVLAALPVRFALHSALTFRGPRGPGAAVRFVRFLASRAAGAVAGVWIAVLLVGRHEFFVAHYNLAALLGMAAGVVVDRLVDRGLNLAPERTPGVFRVAHRPAPSSRANSS